MYPFLPDQEAACLGIGTGFFLVQMLSNSSGVACDTCRKIGNRLMRLHGRFPDADSPDQTNISTFPTMGVSNLGEGPTILDTTAMGVSNPGEGPTILDTTASQKVYLSAIYDLGASQKIYVCNFRRV